MEDGKRRQRWRYTNAGSQWATTTGIVGLVWSFGSVRTLPFSWTVHPSLLSLHSLSCKEESCHCCSYFATRRVLWGCEEQIPLFFIGILVTMSINHSRTASDTVKELWGQQPPKAGPECCQGPSPDIFSPCEWVYVVCWCPKWDTSVLQAAGEKPEKFLKLSGHSTRDRCSTGENHNLEMVACPSLPISKLQRFYCSKGTGCIHTWGQFECRIFHASFRHEAWPTEDKVPGALSSCWIPQGDELKRR